MRIGVLGTGSVGRTLATALDERGHDVVVGTRDPGHGAGAEWGGAHRGSAAVLSEAARHGEVVVVALAGHAVLEVVRSVAGELDGTLVVDVSNSLDFSQGFPPVLSTAPGESLAEQLQAAVPHAAVVKALNTVNSATMVDPGRLGARHTLPVCGSDDAVARLRPLLAELGWPDEDVLHLGDLTAARATEAYVLYWLALFQRLGTPDVSTLVVTPG